MHMFVNRSFYVPKGSATDPKQSLKASQLSASNTAYDNLDYYSSPEKSEKKSSKRYAFQNYSGIGNNIRYPILKEGLKLK